MSQDDEAGQARSSECEQVQGDAASAQKQPLSTKDLSASQIEVIYKATDRLYAKFAHRCGISDSAYWVLYAIVFSNEPVTQGVLADVWSYSKQTVNSAVHTLQEKGLVTLEFAPGNKKSKYITLTEQGKEFSRIYLEPAMKAEERAFATMTLEERAELIRLVNKFTTAIDAEINQLSLSLED